MPKVPEYNHKPLKTIYNPTDSTALASMKQKNYIITLQQRRKLPKTNLSKLTKLKAAILISRLIND